MSSDNKIPRKVKCLSAHADADGCYAAALIGIFCDVETVTFPIKFGSYDRRIDVMVDQRPVDKHYKGLCLDHHPNHPEDREYDLVWETYPTTLIVYNELEKDGIISENPVAYRDHGWKVVGGLAGDGSPEFTPPHIWKDFPSLFAKHTSVWEDWNKGGEWQSFSYPVYGMLASGVNAILRMEHPKRAYDLVKEATSPMDMVFHPEIRSAKDKQKSEVRKIIKSTKLVSFKWVVVWPFRSEYNLQGYLATRLSSQIPNNIMTINLQDPLNAKVSLRGNQARTIRQHLKENLPEVELDGHMKYQGGEMKGVSLQELYRVLAQLE